jgi:hypothetical protein
VFVPSKHETVMLEGYYAESITTFCIALFYFIIALMHLVNDLLFSLHCKQLPPTGTAGGGSPYKRTHRAVFVAMLLDCIVGMALAVDFRTVFGIYSPSTVLYLLATLSCITVIGVIEWLLYTYELVLKMSLEQFSAPYRDLVHCTVPCQQLGIYCFDRGIRSIDLVYVPVCNVPDHRVSSDVY